MDSRRSSSYWSLVSQVLGVVLVLASLFGIPSGARLASASEQTGPTAPSRVGVSAAGSTTYSVYLPAVFRDYSGPPTVFGVQIYEPLQSPGTGLNLAKQAGVSWIRWPVGWSTVEPANTTPDNFNWTGLDAGLTAAASAGAKVILTIDGNPSWAATYQGGRIDRVPLSEYVEFVSALAERYDGDGHNDAPGSPTVQYFEFFNEPDAGSITVGELGYGFWGDYGAEYAQMLCAVAPAMKAANPKAKILMGGIAYDYFRGEDNGVFVREFLDQVLAAGGGQCLDYMVFHYYPGFAFRWASYGPGLSGKAAYLRSKLQQYGVGSLPMMITEAGFHSNAYPAWPSTERLQGSYVVKFFTQAMASDIKALTWWLWSDLPGYPTANGLLTVTMQPKESYYAFQTAVKKLGGSVYQRRLSALELGLLPTNDSVEAYLFRASKPFYVLWSNSSAQQVALPGSTVLVSDLLGNNLGQVTDEGDGLKDGVIHLTANLTPTYVESVQ